mgnify:CR=1 FL=1
MASRPYDPVPANKSRKDAWAILSPNDENNLSRFASVAGLKFTPFGTCSEIPFASPPLILTWSGLIKGFKDYIHTYSVQEDCQMDLFLFKQLRCRVQSELFLNRVGLVLAEELRDSTDQQIVVLLDGLDSLLRDRTPDQITDEMIEGQLDVVEHLHLSDGLISY